MAKECLAILPFMEYFDLEGIIKSQLLALHVTAPRIAPCSRTEAFDPGTAFTY